MPTVDNVKEVEITESWQAPASAEDERLQVFSIERSSVTPQLDRYPFPNQPIVRGRFRYEERSQLGIDRANGTFQVRIQSGLFILRKETGQVNTNKIITEFNEIVNGEFEILDTNILSRAGLWRFIKSASEIVDITVLHPTGDEKTVDDLRDEEGGGPLRVADIADREYPVVSAELIFNPEWAESVHVRYDRSSLSIIASSDEAHEYFVQKFERDVLGGES